MNDLSPSTSYRLQRSQCLTSCVAAFVMLLASASTPALAAGCHCHGHDQAEDAAGSSVSVTLGTDVATQYFFRGIFQEDDGLIVQPYIELGSNLFSGDGVVTSVDWTVGTWHSLHDQHTGTDDNGPDAWYEADSYVGLSAALEGNWSVDVTYTWYNSPNSAFDDVQEIGVALSLDDSESLGLAPSVAVRFETDRAADGVNSGIQLEFGIEPNLTPFPNWEAISVSLPLTVGLSLDDYYQSPVTADDETFGYLELGIKLSTTIAERWSVFAGPYFLFLGDSTEQFNDGDDNGFEVIGKFGVSISF